MTGRTDPEKPHHLLSDVDMEYIEKNPEVLTSWLSRDRVLWWSLGTAFVLGLIAHISGYLLKSSATSEPWGLVAELLYALGFALWTGVVVTLFVQVLPDAKMRQLNEALAEYQEWQKERRRATPRP